MSREHEVAPNEPFWKDDVQLISAVALAGYPAPVEVRARVHHAQERYDAWQGRSEIVSLSYAQGRCEYLLIHPYAVPPGAPTQESRDSRLSRLRLQPSHVVGRRVPQEPIDRLGSGQAWYYPEDRLLVVWELDLNLQARVNQDMPAQDPTFHALWQGFEALLLSRFPGTRLLATPSWEPDCAPRNWQAFLQTLGYQPATRLAHTKCASEGRG